MCALKIKKENLFSKIFYECKGAFPEHLRSMSIEEFMFVNNKLGFGLYRANAQLSATTTKREH